MKSVTKKVRVPLLHIHNKTMNHVWYSGGIYEDGYWMRESTRSESEIYKSLRRSILWDWRNSIFEDIVFSETHTIRETVKNAINPPRRKND